MVDAALQTKLIQQGAQLFQTKPVFSRGVASIDQLPTDDLPEIAFAGRSNVGKSSLINAVTGVDRLARASHTPGRTQELNFFRTGDRFYLVDLPGYGYAAAPEKMVHAWTQLIHAYLRGRVQLKRVFLLIDARHGIKEVDEKMMKMLDAAAVSYQVILTKADKMTAAAAEKRLMETCAIGQKHVACYPEVLLTSSVKKENIDLLRAAIVRVIEGI